MVSVLIGRREVVQLAVDAEVEVTGGNRDGTELDGGAGDVRDEGGQTWRAKVSGSSS
jgi:hypothetical protein